MILKRRDLLFSKFRIRLAPLSITAALCFAVSSFGGMIGEGPDSDLELQNWPGEVWAKLQMATSQGAVLLTNALFSAIDSFDVYSTHLGDRSRATFHVEREVFDNADALGTWTVVDRVRVRAAGTPLGALSTFTDGVATPSLGIPYASFIFEPETDIEWSNIRQVEARNFSKREHLAELRDERRKMEETLSNRYGKEKKSTSQIGGETSPPKKAERKTVPSDPRVHELNPYTPWYYVDPSIRARFSKLLNLATFPFRTPLSVKVVKEKMADGEVISWAFSGGVEIGLGVGWKIIPDPTLQSAGADYRVTAVGRGEYRISVLREDAHFAQVKLSTTGKVGSHRKLTLGFRRNRILESVSPFGKGSTADKLVSSQNLSLVPFETDSTILSGKLFDIAYRYALDTDDGRDAYHHAVLSSFKMSEELALRDLGKPSPTVEKVFQRTAKTDDRDSVTRGVISFAYSRDSEKKLNGIDAQITLPDGDHHIFRSVAEKDTHLKSWFGTNNEKTSYKLSVLLDKNAYEKNDPTSLFIIGESSYEDSSTHANELLRVENEIEAFIGKPDLFPEVPGRVPVKNVGEGQIRTKQAWFSRSSFYWGFHFQRPEVEHFLQIEARDREKLIEKIIPENSRDGISKNWSEAVRAQSEGDPEKIFIALKTLFADRKKGRALMLLLRATLSERAMDYFITASNQSFGRIQERGRAQTSVDRILTLTDQEMMSQNYAIRQKTDFDSLVSSMGRDETGDHKVRISFTLSEEPVVLLFRMSRPSEAFGARDLSEVIYTNLPDNNGVKLFHKGQNVLLLDPNMASDFLSRFTTRLYRDHKYFFQVAFSRDGKKFGSLAGTNFTTGTAFSARVKSGTDSARPDESR